MSRPSITSLRRYWNTRLDPIDWVRARPADPVRWETAHRAFMTPAVAYALRALGDHLRGKRVLEIGCGQGHGTPHLRRRGAEVWAVDLAERRCAIAARRNGDIPFIAAAAEALPFADGFFHGIFFRDVLMYTDRNRALAECERVLAPGGTLALVESLSGHPALRLLRGRAASRDHDALARYLTWAEMRSLAPGLDPVSVRPYYVLSALAFLALLRSGSARTHRLLLATLRPLDAIAFALVPPLAHWAWRAAAVYRKPGARDAR